MPLRASWGPFALAWLLCCLRRKPNQKEKRKKVQQKLGPQKSVQIPKKRVPGEGLFLAVVSVWGGFTSKMCLWSTFCGCTHTERGPQPHFLEKMSGALGHSTILQKSCFLSSKNLNATRFPRGNADFCFFLKLVFYT